MIQHFSFRPLYENQQLPGWTISFFYKQNRYEGIYEKDGVIKWTSETPRNEEQIKKMVHELMLFHVYD
ncbi:YheE family protein [Rummeliibacillus pycnus]|uniref:YheE family protein n=1 Tax=Rummeliibacillus pycnus TaxID=101070 RepID=UPI0037C7C6E0